MIAAKAPKVGERKTPRGGAVSLPKVDSALLAASWRAAGIVSEDAIRLGLSIGLIAALTRKD